MRRVFLHGSLGSHFGGPFYLDVHSAAETARALGVQLPGFMEDIRAGEFRLVRGDPSNGIALSERELRLGLGKADLHVIPVPAGSKRDGVGKVILGVAIAAVAIASSGGLAAGASLDAALAEPAFSVLGQQVSFGSIAAYGLQLAVSGVAQMLTPTPRADFDAVGPPDERPSFLFSGPINIAQQGGGVPLVYGQMRVGWLHPQLPASPTVKSHSSALASCLPVLVSY